MIYENHGTVAFWLSVLYSFLSITFGTFLYAWSRSKVIYWQQRTFAKLPLKKQKRHKKRSKTDVAQKTPTKPLTTPMNSNRI